MKIKAYAKVNLAIDVLGKDESGYHFVDMIMASIDLHDIVQIESREDEIINITSNLKELPIGKDNICYKAAELIKTKLNISNGFNIHIQKNIPMQAGLGGGSADAAAVLNGINNIYNNKIEYDELLNLACKLGADVSFMLKTGMARATHFGEKLEYFIGLKPLKCILVKPDFGVSTATVYSIIDDLYRNQISNIDEIITNLKKNNVYKLVQFVTMY